MKLRPLATLLALLLLAAAPARAQTPAAAPPPVTVPELPPPEPPDERGARGLRADLDRVVGAEESAGWFLDATHLTALYPTMLQSVCRATLAARRSALARVEAEAREAGDPRALMPASGEMNAAVEKALTAERRRMVLAQAVAGAERDCPFWVTPRPGFDGRQTDREQWSLSFESGGLLQLRHTEGRWTYGGGGVGRLLVGKAFGGTLTLLTGVEFAGGAMLRTDGADGRSAFVINYFSALPVIARLRRGALHLDLEGAAVGLTQADDQGVSVGGRVGVGLGISALRTRFILPWAGVALAYEHYVESGGRPPQDFLRAGLRIGGVWVP